MEVALNGADEVSAQLDTLTAKAAHLADMLACARRDAGLIALPVRSQTIELRKAWFPNQRTR